MENLPQKSEGLIGACDEPLDWQTTQNLLFSLEPKISSCHMLSWRRENSNRPYLIRLALTENALRRKG